MSGEYSRHFSAECFEIRDSRRDRSAPPALSVFAVLLRNASRRRLEIGAEFIEFPLDQLARSRTSALRATNVLSQHIELEADISPRHSRCVEMCLLLLV